MVTMEVILLIPSIYCDTGTQIYIQTYRLQSRRFASLLSCWNAKSRTAPPPPPFRHLCVRYYFTLHLAEKSLDFNLSIETGSSSSIVVVRHIDDDGPRLFALYGDRIVKQLTQHIVKSDFYQWRSALSVMGLSVSNLHS